MPLRLDQPTKRLVDGIFTNISWIIGALMVYFLGLNWWQICLYFLAGILINVAFYVYDKRERIFRR